MNRKIVLSLLAGVLTIIGGEIVKISDWHEALTPLFIGALFAQTGGLVTALIAMLYADRPGGADAAASTLEKLGPVVPGK